MILKVPNSIYVTIDNNNSISINNSLYDFYPPFFGITTVNDDIYIAGITKEDYFNKIYEPSVYKCNKNTIESGENISFVCKIPTGNLLVPTSVNLKYKNGNIQTFLGNCGFIYINNTFLYLIDRYIYLSTDLNNWKEIDLYDQINPQEVPEDQNIRLNNPYFFIDNNKFFSYGSNVLSTFEIINEDQLLVNNDNKVDIDHVSIDIIDTLDQINESSSTPQVLSASGVKTELNNIKTYNFSNDTFTTNQDNILFATNIAVDSKENVPSLLIDSSTKTIKPEFLPEDVVATDEVTISKNTNNTLEANNIKVPIIYNTALNRTLWNDSVYVFGESVDNYGKVTVNNYSYYENPYRRLESINEYSITIVNKLEINNNHYKEAFIIQGTSDEDRENYAYTSGIQEFNFSLPSDVASTFGENYIIQIKDVATIAHSEFEDKLYFYVLFTISNEDESISTLYSGFLEFDIINKTFREYSSIKERNSINSKCVVSISEKNNKLKFTSDDVSEVTIGYAYIKLDAESTFISFNSLVYDVLYTTTEHTLVRQNDQIDTAFFESNKPTINGIDYFTESVLNTYLNVHTVSNTQLYKYSDIDNIFNRIFSYGNFSVSTPSYYFCDGKIFDESNSVILDLKDVIFIDNFNNNVIKISGDFTFIGICKNLSRTAVFVYDRNKIESFNKIVYFVNIDNSEVYIVDVITYLTKYHEYSNLKFCYCDDYNQIKLIGDGVGWYKSSGEYNGWFDICLIGTLATNGLLINHATINNPFIQSIDIDKNTIYRYGSIYKCAPPKGACYMRYKDTEDPNKLYLGTTWEEIELTSPITDFTVYKRIS